MPLCDFTKTSIYCECSDEKCPQSKYKDDFKPDYQANIKTKYKRSITKLLKIQKVLKENLFESLDFVKVLRKLKGLK